MFDLGNHKQYKGYKDPQRPIDLYNLATKFM